MRRRGLSLPLSGLSDGVVRLRLPEEADAAAFAAGTSDPDVVRFADLPRERYGVDDALEVISVFAPRARRLRDSILLTVTEPPADDFVGAATLWNIDWERRVGEVGFWLVAEGRGRGLAARAARLLAEWAQRDLGLARIEAYAQVGNPRSQRSLERAGFARQAVERGLALTRGGRADFVRFARGAR